MSGNDMHRVGGGQLGRDYGTQQADAGKRLSFGARMARLFHGNNKSNEVAGKTLEKPQDKENAPITANRTFKQTVQATITSIMQRTMGKKAGASFEAAPQKEKVELEEQPKGMQEFLDTLSSLEHVTSKYLAGEKIAVLDKAMSIVQSKEFQSMTPLEQVACKAKILEACRNNETLLSSKAGTFGDKSVPVHVEEKMAQLTNTLLGHPVPVPPDTSDMKTILDVAVVDVLMKGYDLQPEKLQLGAPLRGNIATCPGTMKLAALLRDECASRGTKELFDTSSKDPVTSVLSGLVSKFTETPSKLLQIHGSQLHDAVKTIQAKQIEYANSPGEKKPLTSKIGDTRTFTTIVFLLRSAVPLISEKSEELSRANATESKKINDTLQQLKNEQSTHKQGSPEHNRLSNAIAKKNEELEELNKEVKALSQFGGVVLKHVTAAQSNPEKFTAEQLSLVNQLTDLILPQSK